MTSDALTLYHGTTSDVEDAIAGDGLRAPCLTDCYATAEYYAEVACDLLGGEPVVYELQLPADALTVDLPGIEEPVLRGKLRDDVSARARAAGLSVEEAVWARANELAGEGGSWAGLTGVQSLQVGGSACYAGTVPFSELAEV